MGQARKSFKIEIRSDENKWSKTDSYLPGKSTVTKKVLGQGGRAAHGPESRSAGPMARQRNGYG